MPLSSLLNFDTWTKELLKKVDAAIPGKVVVRLGGSGSSSALSCHLVSISSRGFGSKLALCVQDQSQGSLFVLFYELQSLYQNGERV